MILFREKKKNLPKYNVGYRRKPKGTRKRAKRRLIVAKVHDRIANKRKNFIHRESRKLVNRFKLIVFEDLKIKNMQAKLSTVEIDCRRELGHDGHGDPEQSGRSWFSGLSSSTPKIQANFVHGATRSLEKSYQIACIVVRFAD